MQNIAMANSSLHGRGGAVANEDQAIIRVGREWLYRSLSIAIFRVGKGQGRDEALLELTLSRARFMELVAATIRTRQECEELFLVGLLSLLDRLLNMPMQKIVEKMKLPAAVSDVLLNREGPHAACLSLTIAVEKGQTGLALKLATALGIMPSAIEHVSLASLHWAQDALGVNGAD